MLMRLRGTKMGWIGKRMKHPDGRIGKVVRDENPPNIFRILHVKFDNEESSVPLWLANVGPNPIESRKWCWEYIHPETNEAKWVEWGQ